MPMPLLPTYAITSSDTMTLTKNPVELVSLNVLYSSSNLSGIHHETALSFLEENCHDNAFRLKVQLSDICFSPSSDTHNTCMGNRGASRLHTIAGHDTLMKECALLLAALNKKALPLDICLPFIRTSSDAASMIDKLAELGLYRGANDIQMFLTCQLPANLIALDQLIAYFDGVLIDLTSLTEFVFGINEHDNSLSQIKTPHVAITRLIEQALHTSKEKGKTLQIILNENDVEYREWADSHDIGVILTS